MSALDNLAAALERAGRRVVRNGQTKAMAQCPAHEDRNPSLSVTQIEGQALVYCHAGCQTDDVLTALSLSRRDLYDDQHGARYDYTDTSGAVLRTVTRTADKRFRPSGQTTGTATLYRLPAIVAAVAEGRPVYLVEGEKDVHALESVGAVATTAPMGARNFGRVDCSPLSGADVIAIPDRDEAGDAWAAAVADALTGKAGSLLWRQARTGKDGADHIAAGHDLNDLDARQTPTATATEPDPEPVRDSANLDFRTVRELREAVRARGPRKWLVRGVVVLGDYGVHGADPKAGKTFNTSDLAVAVASGTPWVGRFPIDTSGPVLMFVGEGGEGNTLRRLDAAAAERGFSNADDLPIVICTRAPYLNDDGHMWQLEDQITRLRPVLVTLDPLYLSAKGAELSDLYKMGALLERPQRICQRYGASLFVVTHNNRQAGTGARRFTGAGPAEWGRFLIAATVKARNPERVTGGTRVLTEWEITGGEIADQTVRVNRHVWADDPDDLDSPLHVETSAEDALTDTAETAPAEALPPAAVKLLEALDALGDGATSAEMVDEVKRRHGHGLTRETVSRTLNRLAEDGIVQAVETDAGSGRFPTKVWARIDRVITCDITRDQSQGDDRVTPCDRPYTVTGSRSRVKDHTAPDTPTSHGGATLQGVAS